MKTYIPIGFGHTDHFEYRQVIPEAISPHVSLQTMPRTALPSCAQVPARRSPARLDPPRLAPSAAGARSA